MQNKFKLLCLATASLVAGTAAASAQGYGWNGDRAGWNHGPAYETVQPRAEYHPDVGGPYDAINGSNHPAPGSTQGDVGPDGNNNGTLTGIYRNW